MRGGSSQQQGFTLLALLLTVGAMGAGLAAFGELASHAAQRDKEAELLFIGRQYRQAIASYYQKEQRYPKTIADLLEDKRYPMAVRHLRKPYADPVTGEAWGLIEAPGGGIMGVHSLSQRVAIKTGNFSAADAALAEAAREAKEPVRYADWQFFHQPAQALLRAPAREGAAPPSAP